MLLLDWYYVYMTSANDLIIVTLTFDAHQIEETQSNELKCTIL